ncbi:MAG TPA: hypothetical protein VGE35_04115 [Candidatus Paceibacterota bacterium]
MKTKHILTAAPLALALFAGAASAQAQILDANLNVGSSASTSESGIKVDATVNGNVDSAANVNTDLNGEVMTTTSADEGTSAELDAYVQTVAATNADLKEVDTTSSNKVVVEYQRPAKLFGFIDVSLTERAVVKADNDGKRSASVSKSWWSIFASDDTRTDEFSDTLKARVENSVSASATGELTASEKAEFIAEINAAAQATYSIDASADTEADVRAGENL